MRFALPVEKGFPFALRCVTVGASAFPTNSRSGACFLGKCAAAFQQEPAGYKNRLPISPT
jgi:hypothetical protein